MQPERYNEFGEIIPELPKPIIYERKLTPHQQHRIHETKDMFDGDCYLCCKAAEKRYKSYWGNDS